MPWVYHYKDERISVEIERGMKENTQGERREYTDIKYLNLKQNCSVEELIESLTMALKEAG